MSSPLPSAVRSRTGVVQVCLAGVSWGTAPIALAAVDDLPSVAASAHRLAIAALVLFTLAAATRTLPTVTTAVRRRPGTLVIIGTGVAAYQALWFAAIVRVGAAVATVLALGLAPILITVWEGIRARRRPGGRQLGVVATGVIGLFLVAAAEPTHSTAMNPVLGLLLAALSGIIYAALTILSRHAAPTTSPLALTTATTTIGAVTLLPIAGLTGPIQPSDPTSLLALSYLGVVTMAGGYLLLYSGLRTVSGSTAAVATLLEPATAAALAVVILGEVIPGSGAVGIALILAAVALLQPEDAE